MCRAVFTSEFSASDCNSFSRISYTEKRRGSDEVRGIEMKLNRGETQERKKRKEGRKEGRKKETNPCIRSEMKEMNDVIAASKRCI
jgi:hypothetical protein